MRRFHCHHLNSIRCLGATAAEKSQLVTYSLALNCAEAAFLQQYGRVCQWARFPVDTYTIKNLTNPDGLSVSRHFGCLSGPSSYLEVLWAWTQASGKQGSGEKQGGGTEGNAWWCQGRMLATSMSSFTASASSYLPSFFNVLKTLSRLRAMDGWSPPN